MSSFFLIIVFNLSIPRDKVFKNVLPITVQNKFDFEEGNQFSKIIIRGLGVTEINNQVNQLTSWFKLFNNEIENFNKEIDNKKIDELLLVSD